MTYARPLDGKAVAKAIKEELKPKVAEFTKSYGEMCLAVILVGDDPASEVYVRNKERACAEVGIKSVVRRLKVSTTDTVSLREEITRCNFNHRIDGILVQLPLPKHIDKFAVLDAIMPHKDVDVFTSTNTGLLIQNRPYLYPCTPQAVREILVRNNIQIQGRRIAIVNRSLVVGQPLASMLIQDNEFANATVTVCHEYTENIKEILRSADIVVTAVGNRNNFCLTGDMIKKDAVVVDVAIIRTDNGLIGDADESVWEKAAWVSPVPGGVGPCTIAMLLSNTIRAAEHQAKTYPTLWRSR